MTATTKIHRDGQNGMGLVLVMVLLVVSVGVTGAMVLVINSSLRQYYLGPAA